MTLVKICCMPRAKQKQQILLVSVFFTQGFMPFFYFLFFLSFSLPLSLSLLLCLPSRWRWSRVFALQMCTWRRLHDSITCWWQNLQKHPLLLSLSFVFSIESVFMRCRVLTLFFQYKYSTNDRNKRIPMVVIVVVVTPIV
jgi:hypothetical protein